MTGGPWWGLLVLLYLAAAATRDPRLFLFVLMLTAAGAASALWSRYSLAQLQYGREIGSTRLFCGEETDLTVDLYNAKPLPLPWVLITDQFPDDLTLVTGELGESRTVAHRRALTNFLAMRWYERVRRTYRVRGDRRGVYLFGPAEVYAGDLFGFRRRHETKPKLDELIVYPKVVPVEGLALPAARPAGEMATALRVVEDPLRYQGVRGYQPGDNYRHIHWKATARSGALQTRTFDPGASHLVMVMIDVQTTARAYSVIPDYIELLVAAAASVASDGLQRGYGIGLVSNGGPAHSPDWTYIAPGRHPGQVVQLLEALARLTAFRLKPFPQLAAAVGMALPFGASVVALSAWPSEETQEALLALRDAGHPVVLLTAGDEAPVVSSQIEHHHLGGTDAWQNLAEFVIS
ncbi:MAG: DUF58 domain-containing protein [Anaerolineae bacterium]